MKKVKMAVALLGLVSSSYGQYKKTDQMNLIPEVKEIAQHLQHIQVFQGKDALDISRKSYESMAVQLEGKKEPVRLIEEYSVNAGGHSIPLRIYRPEGATPNPQPAILYLHGGWFISGGFTTHDWIARKIANATHTIVILVDYRLAPEHPFPAGMDDCKNVLEWMLQNADKLGIDSHRTGVMGDSAGGTLAAVITHLFRKVLRFQVLIYPAADNSLATASWKKYANGPVLSKAGGIQAWNWYIADSSERHNPLAVPLYMRDFRGTPPTLVLLAGHDPLHDEGAQLARNMEANGVPVKTVIYHDMVHGFMHMGGFLTDPQSAVKEIADFTHTILQQP